ncbi:glycosyltransferase family 2 protein [Yersinia massiliensis]|uniref:glycosyltransferase family 2 protein n=1 Tax=Yersinia massiliensis TaxID=419257 RepID=UPI0002E4EF59|nr:glycosyltransferase family 2 protein [Yersinia massiliensis]MCB5306742.1 glycosyltransferase family 2 protein [Yersinia massiliensis]
MIHTTKVAVVLPCYKVKQHILSVLNEIDNLVDKIYVVDDLCPDGSGKYVEENSNDSRVSVIYNSVNMGVGGAVISGYSAAIRDGMDIVVKVDGDGQMDPSLIKYFINPICKGDADYTKGNRFYEIDTLKSMPKVRLFGNAILSFLTKFSSGYYTLFDPTNGYTAISTVALKRLPLDKISKRYFFESDILFRLNIIRAKVIDIPMDAVYGDETSNLNIKKIMFPFLRGHVNNVIKRIFYNYFLRGFSIASLELIIGLIFFFFGAINGVFSWHSSVITGQPATSGTVMLAALPVMLGVQLLLSFIQADVENQPQIALTKLLKDENLN